MLTVIGLTLTMILSPCNEGVSIRVFHFDIFCILVRPCLYMRLRAKRTVELTLYLHASKHYLTHPRSVWILFKFAVSVSAVLANSNQFINSRMWHNLYTRCDERSHTMIRYECMWPGCGTLGRTETVTERTNMMFHFWMSKFIGSVYSENLELRFTRANDGCHEMCML